MCPRWRAHWRKLANTIELVSTTRAANRSVQPFSHSSLLQSVVRHARACHFPNNFPFARGIWTPCFLKRDPPESITQMPSRSVQPFLQRPPQSVAKLYYRPPPSPLKVPLRPTAVSTQITRLIQSLYESSAVAEMGDRLATTDMGRKLGAAVPSFFGEGRVTWWSERRIDSSVRVGAPLFWKGNWVPI